MIPTSDAQNKTLPLAGEPAPDTVVVSQSRSIFDLSNEALLKPAPRITFNQHTVPALGGIPLLAKLGQGGMGAVYFGVHTRLMLEVAVKVLPFQLANQDPTLVQRFFREAQIAAKVKSPHLVGVMDVNEEAGLFYLVMEFVDGRTAGEYCRETMAKEQRLGLSEDVVLDICIAATEGLIAAHNAGVVHRDIKPENILLPRERSGVFHFNQAKLSDLGLARNDSTVQSLTAAQNVMGTPGYMSPEQANDSKNAGKPADVFSMGATLYSLLCGEAPFTGGTTLEAVLNTIQKSHRPITIHRPDVSLELSTLIDRCLSKRPQRRFEDAAALLQGLQECRSLLTNRLTRPVRRPTGANAVLATARTAENDTLPLPRPQGALAGKGLLTKAAASPYAVAAAKEAAAEADVYVRPTPQKQSSALPVLLFGAMLLVGGGLWLAHQHQTVEDARAAEELRAAQQAKEQTDKARAATEEQAQRAKAAIAAAVEEERKKAQQSAAAAAATTPADPHAALPAPADHAPAAPPRQKMQLALQTVIDEAHKAIEQQQQWADKVNDVSVKRHEAAANLNKLQQQLHDAREALGPPPPPPPPDSRRPGGRLPPRDDAREALEDKMKKLEDATQRAEAQVQQVEKQYLEAFNKYNAANASAIDKMNERLKLESELNAAQK